jgi:glycosyltransferase involved in cell wall biosynthesis
MRRGPLHRLKYRRVDRWIAVTGAIRKDLVAWGVAPDRCRTVPSAIDLESVRREAAAVEPDTVRRSLGLDPGTRFVAAIGALDRQKGLDVAVRAADGLRDETLLLVVGDGPERRRLEAGAGPAVRFVGSRDDVPAVLASAVACVVPSLADEGSSAVLKEALAVGCPVVASDLPGLREVGGDAVRWVPAGDAAALARALAELVADPTPAGEQVRRGRERVAAFGVEPMVAAILQVYRDALGARSP